MNEFLQFVDELREKQVDYISNVKELIHDVDFKALSKSVIAMAVGIFLARCGIRDTIYPFGGGYFVCMLLYSSFYKSALAGCFIGWLSLYPTLPFGQMLVSVGTLGVLRAVSGHFKVEKNRLLKTVYIFLSAGGVALFDRSGRYFFIVGVLEAVVSVASLFIFDKASRAILVHKKRHILTDDEALCVAFCLCLPIIFSGKAGIGTFEVNIIMSGFVTMIFAYMFGSTVGTATGVLSGLCVSLGGGSIYVMGSLGVCGFVAGTVKKYGRMAVLTSYIVSNALLTLYINGSSFVILPIGCSLVSGIALLMIPRKVIIRLEELFCNTMDRSKEERHYVEKYNSLAKEKLGNIAGLFTTMAELFNENSRPRNRPDARISRIIKLTADDCCRDCIWHEQCWRDNFLATYSAFEQLSESILQGGDGTLGLGECANEAGVAGSMKRAVADFIEEDKERLRINEGNDFLSKQLLGVASLISGIHSDIKTDIRFESDIEKSIKDELTLQGVMVYDVCVMNISGAYRCEITVNEYGESLECKNQVQRTVGKFCGRPMTMTDSLRKNSRYQLVYAPQKPLKVNSFMAQASKEGVCGDSYKVGYVSDTKYMMCISDGMGSGQSAHDESDACVKLIDSFFKAGFEDSVVFATVNRLLQIRSDKEIFTTVDMCMVDTVRSKAVFTKIGAVPSVLIKGCGHRAVIRGDALPLGILEEVKEKSFEIDIEDGDILVMFTDGVYDVLTEGDGQIEETVGNIVDESRDIRAITSAIIDKCKNGDELKDDMTILVSVFKKTQLRQ